MLIITRHWFFHRPGRNAQRSNAQRDVGGGPRGCPIDKYRRHILRKDGKTFVGRSYPAGANEHNPLWVWDKKK